MDGHRIRNTTFAVRRWFMVNKCDENFVPRYSYNFPNLVIAQSGFYSKRLTNLLNFQASVVVGAVFVLKWA